jgi:glycosyltransferase involved in cell wall biosynthesis
MAVAPLITVAVPSFNQGHYLGQALESIFSQGVPVEVFVADAGSTDGSVEVIQRWQHRLAGWRSAPDAGQSAAINESVAKGAAPYVCWLNSDDWLLPNALKTLVAALESNPGASMAYGRTWDVVQNSGKKTPALVRPFSEWWMARFCIVSQPGTLMRRSAWEAVGGVDASRHMAMDYDLWWRLYKQVGPLQFVDHFVAVNRDHAGTKTNTQRRRHYREAMAVVREHHGRVPLKWWLAQPYAVWFRALVNRLGRRA